MQKAFSLVFIVFCLLSFTLAQPSSKLHGKSDVIQQLLDLPAPRPVDVSDKPSPGLTQYNEKAPPPDNASLDVLEAYWNDKDLKGEKVIPSQVLLRFLEDAEKNPEDLPHYLNNNFIPDTPDAHDRVKVMLDNGYHDPDDTDEQNAKWKQKVSEWLMLHSKHLRDELEQKARALKEERGRRIEGEPYLRGLTKLDWERAQPILAAYVTGSQPRIAAFALSLQYQHAMDSNDSAEAEKLRTRLQSLATDKQVQPFIRNLTCEALLSREWSGRDEWFISLFADETLVTLTEEEYLTYQPLRSAVRADAKHWVPIVAKLIGHNNRIVHDFAVEVLADIGEEDVSKESLERLLPWLTNPNWSGAKSRSDFVANLGLVKLPEALPGLLAIVDGEEKKPAKMSARKKPTEDDEEFDDVKIAAIETLGKYKDNRAVPALKRALLNTTDNSLRGKIIKSLHACGGLTDDEVVKGIEAFARHALATGKDLRELTYATRDEYYEFEEGKPIPVHLNIGHLMLQSDAPHETWAVRLLERIEVLRKTQPSLARLLLAMVQQWSLPVIDNTVVQHIGEGRADIDEIEKALEDRERLRESASDELQSLVRKGGAAAGIAAVLLGDQSLQRSILQGTDKPATRALLAAARYVREALPIEQVNQHLHDSFLGLAAERYLESEDGPEARALVLAKHPGEALILGARADFAVTEKDDYWGAGFDEREKLLRNEVRRENGPSEIIALLGNRHHYGTGEIILRVSKGKTEMTWAKDESRTESRLVEASELQELRDFIAQNAVENLPPFYRPGHHGSEVHEYVRVTKDGGRRVFILTAYRAKKSKELHLRLVNQFAKLTEGKQFKLRYALQERLPQMEVILADDSKPVRSFCIEGNEMRFSTSQEWPKDDIWHSLIGGKFGEEVAVPLIYTTWRRTNMIPDEVRREALWVRFVGEDIFYQTYSRRVERPGLMKLSPGNQSVLLAEGLFAEPQITPDGNWMVTLERNEDRQKSPLVRIDLRSGKKLLVNVPPDVLYEPVAFVPTQEKILLRQRTENEGNKFALLTPHSGAMEAVKGEVAPLLQQTTRLLQPSGKQGEFWAAMYNQKTKATEIGRYNVFTFTFTRAQSIPELKFDSMNLWVDEAGKCLFIVYNGHLLRLPLQP